MFEQLIEQLFPGLPWFEIVVILADVLIAAATLGFLIAISHQIKQDKKVFKQRVDSETFDHIEQFKKEITPELIQITNLLELHNPPRENLKKSLEKIMEMADIFAVKIHSLKLDYDVIDIVMGRMFITINEIQDMYNIIKDAKIQDEHAYYYFSLVVKEIQNYRNSTRI